MAYELGQIRTDRGQFLDKGNLAYNVTHPDFGAIGDGIVDDQEAIQRAIDFASDAGGGAVFFPAGTFLVGQAGSSAWALSLKSNVDLIGAGRGMTTIKLYNEQDKFCRILSGSDRSDITIRDLTINGNKAGNVLNIPGDANAYEQQHAIFLDTCSRVTIENVHIKNTRGDGIYFYDSTARPVVIGCYFDSIDRVAIHAQVFSDALIANCHFWDSSNNNHIKCEMDGATSFSGIAITGCVFDGNTGSNGITLSGYSGGTYGDTIAVVGNVFRNLAAGVVCGYYTRGWTISGNTFSACARGIVDNTYSTDQGYAAKTGVTITGNVFRGLSAATDQYALEVSNATNVVISGNSLEGTTTRMMRVQHCDAVSISNNVLSPSGSDATGISIYRVTDATISGNHMTGGGGASSAAIVVADDVTYASTLISVAGNTLASGFAFGIYANDLSSAGSLVVGVNNLTGATTRVSGFDLAEAGYLSNAPGFKVGWGSAAPVAGAWAVGDQVWNAEPGAGEYMGWICTSAGSPGTWKGFGIIQA